MLYRALCAGSSSASHVFRAIFCFLQDCHGHSSYLVAGVLLPHDSDGKAGYFHAKRVARATRISHELCREGLDEFPPPVTLHLLLLCLAAWHAPVSQTNTNWEGGEYKIHMEFTEDYPSKVGG